MGRILANAPHASVFFAIVLLSFSLFSATSLAQAPNPGHTGSQLEADSITGVQIQNGSLTGTDVQDYTIGAADIAQDSINMASIADGLSLDNTLTVNLRGYNLDIIAAVGRPVITANAATGVVGIGDMNNPSSILNVSGTLRAQNICDETGANCMDISAGWPANPWVITGSDVYRASGRIGVGVVPSYPLDIRGSSSGYPGRVATPDGYLIFGPANTDFSHFVTDRSRFYFNTVVQVDTGQIGSYNEDLYLQTAWTTRMTISNSNGNVAIGTAPSATNRLHVQSADSTNPQLRLSSSSIMGYSEFAHTTNGLMLSTSGTGASNNRIRFASSGVMRMVIDENGQVGLGVVAPFHKIDIYNQTGYPVRISTYNGYVMIGPAGGDWSHFSTDRARFWFNTGLTVDTGQIGSYNEDLSFQTSGTTRMTISNTNGRVGIGSGATVPAASLEVRNGIHVTDGDNKIEICGTNWGTGDCTSTTGISHIVDDDGTYQALMLVGNAVSGSRRVRVYDDLIVSRNTEVINNLSVSGLIHGWNVPSDIKATTTSHTGNFGGWKGIYDWIQVNGCAGYHVCTIDEVTAYVQANGYKAIGTAWVSGGRDLSTGWYDCRGWQAGAGSTERAVTVLSTATYLEFSYNPCSHTGFEVACCK